MKINKLMAPVILAIFFLSGCVTEPEKKTGEQPRSGSKTEGQQNLSSAEKEKVNYYAALSDFYIDELQINPAGPYFETDPNRQAYEGYNVIRLLGLDKILSQDECLQTIKAMFHSIPVNTKVGDPIRNIVIPGYYDNNGGPLIIHITFAYSGNKRPSVVCMFNTSKNIRNMDPPYIRRLGPTLAYPRIFNDNGKLTIEGGDVYSFQLIVENGIVSASGAVDRKLPAFDSVTDITEKVNLTDYYLRDADPSNDEEVLPVLYSAISTADNPINKLHAYMQLFMYYLFKNDLPQAQEQLDAVQAAGLLQADQVKDTEIASVVEHDMPAILAIAEALSK